MDTLIVEPSAAGHKPKKGRREHADEQLFARLIGAAVLLAIAVIVLPFVLDGSGSQREYEYAETLPVEPPRPAVEKSFSSRQPLDPALSPETINARVPAPTPLDGMENTQAINNTASVDRTVSDSSAGTVVREQPDTTGPTASTDFETLGNGSLQSLGIQPGWNIQVASFVRDANAVKLISRLRAENLTAYANRVQGSSRVVVRVLVGPFANQIDALAQQNRIDRAYQVESLIVRGK